MAFPSLSAAHGLQIPRRCFSRLLRAAGAAGNSFGSIIILILIILIIIEATRNESVSQSL
jgi:hypothetical protein